MTDIKVADVMTTDVFALAPDTSIETASRMFAQKHITGAPVVDTSGETIGVVSVADLVDPDRDRGNEEGYPVYYRVTDGWAAPMGDATVVRDGRVEEVMTRSVVSTDQTNTIIDAAKVMLDAGIHRLLVTNDGELAGIVSTTDLLRGFVEQSQRDVEKAS